MFAFESLSDYKSNIEDSYGNHAIDDGSSLLLSPKNFHFENESPSKTPDDTKDEIPILIEKCLASYILDMDSNWMFSQIRISPVKNNADCLTSANVSPLKVTPISVDISNCKDSLNNPKVTKQKIKVPKETKKSRKILQNASTKVKVSTCKQMKNPPKKITSPAKSSSKALKRPKLCPMPPELMTPTKRPVKRAPQRRQGRVSTTIQKIPSSSSSIVNKTINSIATAALARTVTKTSYSRSQLNSAASQSSTNNVKPEEVIVASDVNSLMDIFESKTSEEFCQSLFEVDKFSKRSDFKPISTRPLFCVDVDVATIHANKKLEESKHNHQYHPMDDHSYCQFSADFPLCTNYSNISSTKHVNSADEISIPKSATTSKVLKYHDYVKLVRKGAKSAPCSPTTSPKIPRGASRKVNNFMVSDGSKQLNAIPVVQSQQLIPSSPLLDPLTVLKQGRPKAPTLQLQEFEQYLAQLENGQNPKAENEVLSSSNNVAINPVTSTEFISRNGTTASKPHCEMHFNIASSLTVTTVSTVSVSSLSSSKVSVSSCDSSKGRTGLFKNSPTSRVASNDPREKSSLRLKQKASLQPIPNTKWYLTSKSDANIVSSNKKHFRESEKLRIGQHSSKTSFSNEKQNNSLNRSNEEQVKYYMKLLKEQRANQSSRPNLSNSSVKRHERRSEMYFRKYNSRKDIAGDQTNALSDLTGKVLDMLGSLKHQQQMLTSCASAATADLERTLKKFLHATKNTREKGIPTSASESRIDQRNSSTCSNTVTKPPRKNVLAKASPMSLIHEINLNMKKMTETLDDTKSSHSKQVPKNSVRAKSSSPKVQYGESSSTLPATRSSSCGPCDISQDSSVHNNALTVQQYANADQSPKHFSSIPNKNIRYPLPSSLKENCEGQIVSEEKQNLSGNMSSNFLSGKDAVNPASLASSKEDAKCSHSISVIISQKPDASVQPKCETSTLVNHNVTVQETEKVNVNCDQELFDEISVDLLSKAASSNPSISSLKESCVEATANQSQELEEGELYDDVIANHSKCSKKTTDCSNKIIEGALSNFDNLPVSDSSSLVSGDGSLSSSIARFVGHQGSLFGIQQNRGLSFSTSLSQTNTANEGDIDDDALSLDVGDETPAHSTDLSEESDNFEKNRKRKRRKKRRKHKRSSRKRGSRRRHHHHRRRKKARTNYKSDKDSDSSYYRDRRRSRKRKSFVSSDQTSSSEDISRSRTSSRHRRYSRDSYSPKRRRYSTSLSRSRSRSPIQRRSWRRERSDGSFQRRSVRESRSLSSVERCDRRERISTTKEWDYISRKSMQERKDKAIRERRVMYVGRISSSTTKVALRQRFRKFGPIDDVDLYFRHHKDSYAFVTFRNAENACIAIEKGNEDHAIKYDLCFGGRRQFCQMEYADLDGEKTNNANCGDEDEDFDTLLRKAMKR